MNSRTEFAQSDVLVEHSVNYAGMDSTQFKSTYTAQDEFVFVPDFLPKDALAQIQARLPALRDAVHRNFIPKHKKGGSISRYQIDQLAPEIADLYVDKSFKAWLEALCGVRLMQSPANDPHAYALYYYTEAGDHIGYHYDTSYYRGDRYTVLIGIVDDSSCRLEYQLYRRSRTRESVSGSVALTPGALAFFHGDKLYHRITPLREGEQRISLTLEYVTDPRMYPWHRFVSNMKDAIAYFGFRQIMRR